MDKRRVKAILRILDGAKLNFPETIQFNEDCLEQERSKENITVEEVIFFFFFFKKTGSKKLVQKNIFYFVVLGFKVERFSLHLTKHVKINSLSYDIYFRVIWI